MKFTRCYTTRTPGDTIHLGAKLAKELILYLHDNSVVIYLNGDLGVGKTQFVKGLGVGLGVEETITSPSYVYMRNYRFHTDRVEGELVHIDGWRTLGAEELMSTGLSMFLLPGNLVAIEWPRELSRLSAFVSRYDALEVVVSINDENTDRMIKIQSDLEIKL